MLTMMSMQIPDELVSFQKALVGINLNQDLFVSFGDVLFKPYLLQLMDGY